MLNPLDHVQPTIRPTAPGIIRTYRSLVLIAILLGATTSGTHAIADSLPRHRTTLQSMPSAKNPARDNARTLLFLYVAAGVWLTLLCAGTLAILIIAHKIAASQPYRNPREL